MKKLLVLLFLCFSIPAILMGRSFSEKAKEEAPAKNEEVTVREEKENTLSVISGEEKKEETAQDGRNDGPQIYRMLDFDRRLILNVGEQDDNVCSIFCLAYARAILDEDYNADPYDYWDEGAVWRWADYEDIAGADPLKKVLQSAYDRIGEGVPVLFYVDGTYAYTVSETPQPRTSNEHFVLIIGYKKDADYADLKPSDFYAADPSAGYKGNTDAYMPWCTLTDESPLKVSGEYALYAPVDPYEHVEVCEAYADTSRWDADRSDPIYPEYVGNEE